MIVQIRNEVPAYPSYAAERTRGLYNVDADDGRRFEMDVDVPVDSKDAWQVGVVVGPSGSGKTSIARALAEAGWNEWDPEGDWSGGKPIIEELTEAAGTYAKATASLAAVGLGSVPAWLRPHGVLSNGEQFRANLAMLLVAGHHYGEDVLIDEFTSVLDRQVAKAGAAAFVKQWRRKEGRRVILITPHYDILEWVEPDWWIDTAEGLDKLREDRGVVRARKGAFQEAADRARYPGDEVGAVVA